jgi:hypothetical protein
MVGEHPAADTPGGAGPRPGLRRPAVTASPYPALGPASCRSPDWPWRTWARWGTDERERYVLAGGTCVCDRRTAKDELTSTESGDRRV